VTHRIVIISDCQMPYEHRKAVQAIIRFIGEYQPDEVIHIGDLMDYPQPSRWNKDTRREYVGSVQEDSEYAKRKFLEPLRSVYDGPVGVHEGNHDLRPRAYLDEYAPALSGVGDKPFHFETLLDFDGFGVTRLPDFNKIAPGWITTHGHLGKISLSRIAGNTALNAAKNFQTSVIMGHTHRMGKLSHTFGYGGEITRMVTGVEVGHLMDLRQASEQYLKRGTANWQLGFAVAKVNGRNVQVDTIPIVNRMFNVDGVTYRV
jgi:predicted phosphodiesterase